VRATSRQPTSEIATLFGQLREIVRETERVKAMLGAKVEQAFHVMKCVFGYFKVRYRGLAKNGAQVLRLFVLVNLHKAAVSLTG
jgi:transposase, IS5 family